MKNKLPFRRIFATLLLSVVSTISWAYDFEVDGIYYNKNEDGTSVTVTYRDYNYRSYSGNVSIPNSVIYEDVTYGVTSIGQASFYNCTGLTSVTIPNSVTTIGKNAFSYCSSLTSITIPNSVTSIGNDAFRDCSSLTSITIPNSVTSIGAEAFYGCSGLPVEGNVRYADTYLVGAVDKTQGSYTIKEGTRFIGYKAFYNCSSLTSIAIPNSVTSIGNVAFDGCRSFTSVTIPNSVTSIGNDAFYGCRSLTSVTIPNSVTSIGNDAFRDCSGLTSVTIPNSVTSIGASAFSGCRSLTRAEFASIESLCKISFVTFESNPLYYACHLYINGQEVTEVVIPESVTSIGQASFSGCSSLTSVTIPESVTSIGSAAFSGCTGLTSVTIPESVTSIGSAAFSGCTGLTRAEFASIESLFNISFGNDESNPLLYAHHLYIDGSEVTTLVIPNSVTSISSSLFSQCSGLTSVTIPESVTSIGERAFFGCRSLTSVTIPNSITSIGGYTFYGCSGLTSVTIPNSVTSIGDKAFAYCSSLTSVTIPESVTSIGEGAFEDCKFRTIVSKPTQPNGFPDTFSQQEYNHSQLYVPQNTYWDYVFNSEWYRFLHIKEFAVDEVQARQAYMLAEADGTNFTVYNAAKNALETKEYSHQVDETSLNSNWVAEPYGSGTALLNLGSEKYASISSDGTISLSDTPVALDIEFNDGVATANGRQMMLVLNDDDDITDVVTLRYTPSASKDSFDPNAPIYDLMGRRLQQKPASGYYIQGGKKYLVK